MFIDELPGCAARTVPTKYSPSYMDMARFLKRLGEERKDLGGSPTFDHSHSDMTTHTGRAFHVPSVQ